MRKSALFGCLALAFAASAGAQAQTATKFDLICSGTRQMGLEAAAVAHEYRIRVDLDAGRWCWDACERTFEIAEAAPDRIVFAKDEVDTPRQRRTLENAVSRLTGEHRLVSIETRPLPRFMETKGQCEPGSFSGFPAARF
ncbi:MAG: hypothetical protein J0M21_00510 [Xanthomonadales bacterium]|nr:hypothetical protein [Xanthomonadales bacterium]